MEKTRGFVGLLVWPIVAAIFSVMVGAKLYLSMFLFFGIPSIYLSYTYVRFVKKAFWFSIVSAIALGSLFDYVMQTTGGWEIGRTEFPNFWILEHVSLIQIIWLFLYVYFILLFYEAYFDKEKQKALYPKVKYFIYIMAGIFGFVVFTHFFAPSLLIINYFYAKAGLILFLLPMIAVLFKFPSLYGKLLKVASFFFYYSLLYEITALELKQWNYPIPSQFVGYMSIYKYSFPIEEFFFWIMLGALAVLTYYEYFDDDQK